MDYTSKIKECAENKNLLSLLMKPLDEPNYVEMQELYKFLNIAEIYSIDPIKIINGEIDKSILSLLQLKMFIDGIIEFGEASQDVQEEIKNYTNKDVEIKNTQKRKQNNKSNIIKFNKLDK